LRRWLTGGVLAAATAVAYYSWDVPTETPSVPSGYDHDRYGTQPIDQRRDFQAFISSFDGADDDNGDGLADTLGIPQWVAYQISRHTGSFNSSKRPRKWSTDSALAAASLAPTDNTYRYSAAFRKTHPNWYVRGHLAMKYHCKHPPFRGSLN
jgi:endonuclease G, mitochondrial